MLKAGAGTGAIAAHAEYKRGYPSLDPEDAPLNTAALFVAISASLETIGRRGLASNELAARASQAIELFELLATAPGSALRDDVFSVCVSWYHDFEECFGNVTAMCRACFDGLVDSKVAKKIQVAGGTLNIRPANAIPQCPLCREPATTAKPLNVVASVVKVAEARKREARSGSPTERTLEA